MGRRDEEEDDDRGSRQRSEAAAGESGGMTAVKILAIIGVVVLAVVLVCGGLAATGIYFAYRAADDARKDITKQLDAEIKRQREFEQKQELIRQKMNEKW